MKPTSLGLRLAGAATLSLCAAPALAEHTPLTLPGITVSAEAEPSLTVPSFEAAEEQLSRIPGAVKAVLAEDYRDGRAANLKDDLDFVPGVFVQPKYGQEDLRLSIRGSGLSRNFHLRGIRLLIDGIPINEADGGGDPQEIDPLTFRYTEVYRGGNALQYGAASLGGAINFVSPTGYNAPAYLSRVEIGSFGTKRVQLAAGGVEGKWDYYASPTYSSSDGYRDHSEQDYLRFSGNLGYRVSPKVETRFYLNLNTIDQDIPSSLTKARALTSPQSTQTSSFTQDTARDIDSIRVANRTSFLLGDWDVMLGASYTNKDLFHPLSFGVIDNSYENAGLYARGTQEGELFGNRSRITLGANVIAGINRARIWQNIGGSRGSIQFNDVDEKSYNYELYGEIEHYLTTGIALIAGAQLNHSIRELDDNQLSNGDDTGRKTFTSVNPKLGVLWDVTEEAQLFANVSRASEPPTFSELNPSSAPGFADLDPQEAWTAEIGTRGGNERVGWDLSLYRAWIENELQLFVTPGSGQGGFALNADETIHQGIELGLNVKLLDGLFAAPGDDKLFWRQAYTLNDFHFDGDAAFGDNELPGAPKHFLRTELRYENEDGFYIAPNAEWVPEGYHVDNANTDAFKTEDYVIYGVKAGYDFGNGLSVYADGRNLLDRTYISNTNARTVATATDALYNPGDGRALYVGMEIRF
jgi:iron complex outermembrane receptor protein